MADIAKAIGRMYVQNEKLRGEIRSLKRINRYLSKELHELQMDRASEAPRKTNGGFNYEDYLDRREVAAAVDRDVF